MLSNLPAVPPSAPCRWPWLLLALALAWAAAVRVPLVLNADAHLDSDLAVDGLTLLEATRGHRRWHYPGTPYMGTLPVLLSWPQAMVGGANPVTLVSGGAVAFLALIVATFLMTWRAFGPAVAGWGLVPLAFASTGALWLSGRVTGGHVLTAAWHAGAFALLAECLSRGGRGWVVALGVWCGLGLYLDAMFAVTLAGLVPAAAVGWWASGHSWRAAGRGLLFAPALLVGAAPRELGRRLEPYDAYRDQFQTVTDRAVLAEHARILARECLPRLIAGHRLPGLQADPDPSSLSGAAPLTARGDPHPLAVATTVVSLALAAAALVALVRASLGFGSEYGGLRHHSPPQPSPARGEGARISPSPLAGEGWGGGVRSQERTTGQPAQAVSIGLLISALVAVAGFVLNRNIFNSDNYRYLVTLLVPWSVGFGLAFHALSRRGRGGLAAAALGALLFAGLMTLDAARWYARFGWLDPRGLPARKPLDDPVLAWLDAHPEVRHVAGGYWDVYRLAFLTGGRVRGTPFPVFPDRFPEWSRGLPGGHPPVLIARPTPEGKFFADRSLLAGGRVLYRARGLTILSWPE